MCVRWMLFCFFFFQAEDGIRDDLVTGVQTCALPISTIWFRGREMTHRELGSRILEKLEKDLADISEVEMRPRMEGNQMFTIFGPKRHKGGAKPASSSQSGGGDKPKPAPGTPAAPAPPATPAAAPVPPSAPAAPAGA